MDVCVIDDGFTLDVVEDPSEETYCDEYIKYLSQIETQNAQTVDDSKNEQKRHNSLNTKRDSVNTVEKLEIEEHKVENTESLDEENDGKASKKKTCYKCSLCGYYTICSASYLYHMQAHSDPKNKLFKCRYCDYATFHKSTVSSHMGRCMPKEKRVECSLCEFTTTKRKHLKSHMQNVHENKKKGKKRLTNYRCKGCDFITRNKKDFKHHQMEIHGNKVKCTKCDLEFLTKTEAGKHAKSHHQDEYQIVQKIRIYKCDYCDYESKYVENVRRHRTAKHVQQLVEI